jgi:hypothetical protein
VQEFFVDQFKKFEEKEWATMADAAADAENCNVGKQPCKLGKLAKLTIVPVKPEDMAEYKRLIESVVLKNWAKRCGDTCTKEWNDTVGKALGLTATAN